MAQIPFIINFFILTPPLGDILKGMIPRIPDVTTTGGSSPFLVISSMVGTTVASCIFIVRTTLVKEAGWGPDDLTIERRDERLSVPFTLKLSREGMLTAEAEIYQVLLPFEGPIKLVSDPDETVIYTDAGVYDLSEEAASQPAFRANLLSAST